MSSKFKIRVFLVIFTILLIPSYNSFGRGIEKMQLQNEIFFPIIFNSQFNQVPPTKTPRPTQTRTPTRTRVPILPPTQRPTATQTPTYTQTPTVTPTPTYTATITLIPFPPVTIQYPSQVPSITPSPTRSPTVTPSMTPDSGLLPGVPTITRTPLFFIIVLWLAFIIWLYYFFRNRR